jgi:hypothetical protein
MMKRTLTTELARRRALKTLGVAVTLPLSFQPSVQAAQMLSQPLANRLWRPVDSPRS